MKIITFVFEGMILGCISKPLGLVVNKKLSKILIFMFIVFVVSIGQGKTSLRVCEADGITPFDNRNIMVGTKLTLLVSSDSAEYWNGGLFVEGEDRAMASLTARDKDPNSRDWFGSHLEAAGESAKVTGWQDSNIWGYDLYTVDSNSIAGDWFIIDYKAIDVGEPNVGFYEYDISWDDPNSFISFCHVRTRDFNNDGIINLPDYDLFASYWMVDDCNEPNWCEGTDLDTDGEVDIDDLILFSDFWLEKTIYFDPIVNPEQDPSVIFKITDVNGLTEINMSTGESITLYITMTTTGDIVCLFDLEVNISDPNFGSIDNTAYDPNNPPGLGTARILATPRDPSLDDWGPGIKQYEGIRLSGGGIQSPIEDGNLASFVYACQASGDVVLELVNWNSATYASLGTILIHQIDAGSEQMMSSTLDTTSEIDATSSIEQITNLTLDEMVELLEQIWREEEDIRNAIDRNSWNEFIESVKESYTTDWTMN